MDHDLTKYSILIALWLTVWGYIAARNLISVRRSTISYCILVHFLLYGVPLWLDFSFGPPSYANYPRFSDATQDGKTNVIYLLYVAAVPAFWWITRSRKRPTSLLNQNWLGVIGSPRFLSFLKAVVIGLMVLPCALIVFGPVPRFYLRYAASLSNTLTHDQLLFEQLLGLSATISALIAVFAFFQPSRPKQMKLFLITVVLLDIWLNGKRAIVALILVSSIVIRLQSASFRGFSVVRAALLAGFATFSFSSFYQVTQRPYYIDQTVDKYQDFRLDFGRDHTLRTNIYALLYDGSILPLPLESLRFYITYFIPRTVWADKPYAYATYFTAYVYHLPVKWFGFSLTTTVLGEALDNFGWSGFAIGPLLVTLLCRLGERPSQPLARYLTVVIVNALLVVELAAFLPVALLWLSLIVWERYNVRSHPLTSMPPLPTLRDVRLLEHNSMVTSDG